jgi:transcriptional regulator with XRE-family HTH domain
MRTIRELRQGRGWTQLELANRLGVTPSTVYNWERDKHPLSAAMLRQIARVFEVSMDDIVLPAATVEGNAAA